MVDCVKAMMNATEAIPVPYVDWEVIPNFDGSPEDMFVWFICDKKTNKDNFKKIGLPIATEKLKKLMTNAGFPESAVNTLRTDVTSLEDISDGGGKFYFFR